MVLIQAYQALLVVQFAPLNSSVHSRMVPGNSVNVHFLCSIASDSIDAEEMVGSHIRRSVRVLSSGRCLSKREGGGGWQCVEGPNQFSGLG